MYNLLVQRVGSFRNSMRPILNALYKLKFQNCCKCSDASQAWIFSIPH